MMCGMDVNTLIKFGSSNTRFRNLMMDKRLYVDCIEPKLKLQQRVGFAIIGMKLEFQHDLRNEDSVYSCSTIGETSEGCKYNITWFCNEHELAFFQEYEYDGPENEDNEDNASPDPALPPNSSEGADKRTKWFRAKYDGLKTIINCNADFMFDQRILDFKVISVLTIGILKYTLRQFTKFLEQQDALLEEKEYTLDLGVYYQAEGCNDPLLIMDAITVDQTAVSLIAFADIKLEEGIDYLERKGAKEVERMKKEKRKEDPIYKETVAKNAEIQYIRLQRKNLAKLLEQVKIAWKPERYSEHHITRCKKIIQRVELALRKSKHGHSDHKELDELYKKLLDCLDD